MSVWPPQSGPRRLWALSAGVGFLASATAWSRSRPGLSEAERLLAVFRVPGTATKAAARTPSPITVSSRTRTSTRMRQAWAAGLRTRRRPSATRRRIRASRSNPASEHRPASRRSAPRAVSRPHAQAQPGRAVSRPLVNPTRALARQPKTTRNTVKRETNSCSSTSFVS